MKQSPIAISSGQLKSPLAPAAAVLFSLSALLALPGVVLLFDPEYAALLVQDRIDGGIVLGSSLKIWYLIDTTITILCFTCPAAMAVCLWSVLRGRVTAGMKVVTTLLQVLLWCVYGSAIWALVVFLFQLVRSIVFYLGFNEGAYYIYGMLVTEGLMAVQAWLIYRVLCKFLREGADCGFSIAYTLSSGKLDSIPLPSFPALGLMILGLMGLVLGWDKAYTLTIVTVHSQSVYKVLAGQHPGQYLAAAAMATGALGNFLLAAYLRRYNRICERTRFDATRKKLD